MLFFPLKAASVFRRAFGSLGFVVLMTVFSTQIARAQGAQADKLGPDDVVNVVVLRHPELSIEQQIVSSAGRIQVPAVGDIYVAGKTTAEAADAIEQRLKKTLLRPEVTVLLRSQRLRKIFVLGAVKTTGSYDVKPGFRVTEALALAGGLMALPNQVDGFLNRPGAKPIALDLPAIYADGASKSNYVLRNGDVLQFNERVLRINVAGQINKPGAVNVPIGEGIVQAISLAGGATSEAALSRVVVRRDGRETPVDLYKAIVQGQGEDSFKLRAGDLILVPKAQDRVSVLGAVQRPSFYNIPDGKTMNVSDALAQAGGGNQRAALSRAVLRRADGTQAPLDLYKIIVQGSQDGNATLSNGDSIVVPESLGVTVIGSIGRPGTIYLEESKTPRLTDVLAQAGGLNIRPELARVSITRRTPTVGSKPFTMSVDAAALLLQNDSSQNAEVQDGDVITVAGVKSQVIFISGEVKTPGGYDLREADGLPELLARSGGPTLLASLRRITITHSDGKVQMIDALDAIKKGEGNKIKFQDGDYVVVPQNPNRVLVMAAVKNPGTYALPEDRPLTVGEALSLAGGATDTAKLKQIAILHPSPQGMQRRVLSLNGSKNVQINSSVVLQSGDILYVPQGTQSQSAWDVISRGVGLLSVFGL